MKTALFYNTSARKFEPFYSLRTSDIRIGVSKEDTLSCMESKMKVTHRFCMV
jgi:hypothetical protein